MRIFTSRSHYKLGNTYIFVSFAPECLVRARNFRSLPLTLATTSSVLAQVWSMEFAPNECCGATQEGNKSRGMLGVALDVFARLPPIRMPNEIVLKKSLPLFNAREGKKAINIFRFSVDDAKKSMAYRRCRFVVRLLPHVTLTLAATFLLPRFAHCTRCNEFWWCHNDNIKCYLNCTAYKHAHTARTGLPSHKTRALVLFVRWVGRSFGCSLCAPACNFDRAKVPFITRGFSLVALDGIFMSEMCYVYFFFIFASHKLAI